MLPVQDLLVVDELGALRVDQLLPEVLVLQKIEEVQAHRVPADAQGDGGKNKTRKNIRKTN